MDDCISRAEHEEFCRRMEAENKRLEDENNRQNKRIAAIEEKLDELIDLSTSIKAMTTEIKAMTGEIEKMGKRLATLEGRDGDTWRTVVDHAITAAVGAVICYFFTRIGM